MEKELKAIYLAALLIVALLLSFSMKDEIFGPDPSTVHIAIFSVTVGLLLFPFFREFTVAGISIKKDIKEATNEVKSSIDRLTQTISTTNNMTIQVGSTSNEQELNKLKKDVEDLISSKPKSRPTTTRNKKETTDTKRPDDEQISMFSARFALESELRDLAERYSLYLGDKPALAGTILRTLVRRELLKPKIYDAVREVLAICNAAVHGQYVSLAQADFVKTVMPELISEIRNT